MTMDAGFVKEFKASVTQPVKIDDRIIVPAGWEEKRQPAPFTPQTIELSTLTGLRDYLNLGPMDGALGLMFLHVASPSRVSVLSGVADQEKQYQRIKAAEASVLASAVQYGQYQDAESFIISMMTQFADSMDRARLLQLVASIKDSASLTLSDDGMSQMVATQRGAVFSNRETVNNPFTLAPFRTFREVAQPESPFVLRMRSVEGDRPKLALFECDGGAWQLEAITSVAKWLRENVKGVAVIA